MISSIYDVNPAYLVKLQGFDENGDSVYIVGCMQETFSLSAHSEWEPVMPNMNVLNAISQRHSDVASLLSRGLGYSPTSQYGSNLIWSGTSPISFDLNITFFALSNAESEVLGPSMRALSLVLPSQTMQSGTVGSSIINNLTVRTPGPALIKNVANSYSLDLYIGKIYHFANVIVTGASVENKSIFGSNGLYLVSNVNMTISTSKIYTKSDLQKVVGTRYAGTSSTTGGGLISSLFSGL